MSSQATAVDYATRAWVAQTIRSELTIAFEQKLQPLIDKAFSAAIAEAVASAQRGTNQAINGFAAKLFYTIPRLIDQAVVAAVPSASVNKGAIATAIEAAFSNELKGHGKALRYDKLA